MIAVSKGKMRLIGDNHPRIQMAVMVYVAFVCGVAPLVLLAVAPSKAKLTVAFGLVGALVGVLVYLTVTNVVGFRLLRRQISRFGLACMVFLLGFGQAFAAFLSWLPPGHAPRNWMFPLGVWAGVLAGFVACNPFWNGEPSSVARLPQLPR